MNKQPNAAFEFTIGVLFFVVTIAIIVLTVDAYRMSQSLYRSQKESTRTEWNGQDHRRENNHKERTK